METMMALIDIQDLMYILGLIGGYRLMEEA